MSFLIWTPAIVAGGFVAAELAARFCIRQFGGYFPLAPRMRQRFELDREALPSLEPIVNWRVNSAGERGDEYKPGDARILIAGGSCVEGYYLDQESTVAGQLQDRLAGHFGTRGVHVGSVARSRISCAQIRQMLKPSVGRFGKLDCAVLMVGASDMVRWLEAGAPQSDWQDSASLTHLFGLHPMGAFSWKPSGLALRSLAVRIHRRLFPQTENRSGVGKRLIALRAQRASCESLIETVGDPGLMLERYREELGGLVDDLRMVAKRVVIAYQPWFGKPMSEDERKVMWNFGAGELYGGAVAQFYSHDLINELLQKVAGVSAEVAAAKGTLAVDTPKLLKPGLDNYYDFMHFTPRGAGLVADLINQAIRSDGDLDVAE